MATETVERPTQAHPARRLALGPYVTRVRSWCLDNERTGRRQSISLRLGYETLAFDPPEFAMLLHAARAGEETPPEGAGLPLEILGLLTKSHEDLANLRSLKDPTSRAVFALQAELMLDSALGTALLAELEPCIDERALFDDKPAAGTLAQLRELLRRTVATVSATVSESERERAGDLASNLTNRPLAPAQTQTLPTPPTRRVEPTATLDVVRGGAGRKEFSLTAFLGVGLVLALAIWLGLFVLPGFRRPVIEPLKLSAFPDLLVLSEVEARPPSLFVQVDRERWSSLDEAGRLAIVDEVSGVLSRKAYTGALFETGDGLPVAQWLRDRGARLIGDPVIGGTAERPIAAE